MSGARVRVLISLEKRDKGDQKNANIQQAVRRSSFHSTDSNNRRGVSQNYFPRTAQAAVSLITPLRDLPELQSLQSLVKSQF